MSSLQVCLSAECDETVSWLLLSPLRGRDSLTMSLTDKLYIYICIYILLMVNVNVNVKVHVDIFGLSSWIEQHWMETLWVKKVGPMG